MKGLKPPTAEEAYQAKKKVALGKIERDFAAEDFAAKAAKVSKDALQLASEFSPEELAAYILTLVVQDPADLPEVEIAREKPLPFKPSGNSHGGRGRGGRRDGGYRSGNRDRNRRDNYRDNRRNDRYDRDNRYRKNKNQKPQNTSSEKKTGFVIRNKGDK